MEFSIISFFSSSIAWSRTYIGVSSSDQLISSTIIDSDSPSGYSALDIRILCLGLTNGSLSLLIVSNSISI